MIVSTICLTKDDLYVDMEGNRPKGNSFDKKLLIELCREKIVSREAVKQLSTDVIRVVEWDDKIEPEMPITIREIDGLTDLLIVSRSLTLIGQGKTFRFDNFELIVKDRKIELWKRTIRG